MSEKNNPYDSNSMTPDHHRSSGGGAMKWILITLIVLLLLVGGCVGSCFMFTSWFGGMINAPMDDFVEYANSDSRITDRLGTPIEQVSVGQGGTWNASINNNQADINMTIKGPNGQAEVSGDMTSNGDTWTPSFITVTFSDGTTISVPE